MAVGCGNLHHPVGILCMGIGSRGREEVEVIELTTLQLASIILGVLALGILIGAFTPERVKRSPQIGENDERD